MICWAVGFVVYKHFQFQGSLAQRECKLRIRCASAEHYDRESRDAVPSNHLVIIFTSQLLVLLLALAILTMGIYAISLTPVGLRELLVWCVKFSFIN